MTFYTNRSQIVEAQRCPRKRWWSQFSLPAPCQCGRKPSCPHCLGTGTVTGIEPLRQRAPLLLGRAVHRALDYLLQNGLGGLEEAVSLAHAMYEAELEGRGLDLKVSEEQAYVASEQMALGEALVRLAALRVVPRLLDRYHVVWTERALEAPLAEGVTLWGRVDALLREKSTGDLYLLSWKTKGGASLDERATEDAQHDDQGLSETWLVEEWLEGQRGDLPTQTSGVIMVWLLKGDRREQPKGSGQWQQSSPLIRAYRRFNDAGEAEWAHSWYWEHNGSRHTLGKGWERLDAWTMEGGVKGWIDRLATGTVQPLAPSPLDTQFVVSSPYYRQPHDINDWVSQATGQEAEAGLLASSGHPMWFFKQHRHSCSYPSRCEFYDLCWSAPHKREDPLGNGFVRRGPHISLNGTGERDNG